MNSISIALCTYNGAEFLEDQLQSYLDQSRCPDELVVRDDGSTDGTVALLFSFAERAPFPVRILEGHGTLGYARNFEAVISACTGDLIALSDQDDVWLPNKLSRLEGALGDSPDALLAFSDAALVDAALRPLGRTMWQALRFTADAQKRTRLGGVGSPLLRGVYVTGATVCFRKSLVPIALPLPLSYWHDAWLALMATLHGRVVPVPEPLVLYRQHGANALGAPPETLDLSSRIAGVIRPDAAQVAELVAVADQVRSLMHHACERVPEAPPEMVDALERASRHYALRAYLPSQPRRVGTVLRELVRGGYHTYGRGLLTAARDLLR